MTDVATLAELFALEPYGAATFVGRNGRRRGVGDSVFGGQLVSQALRAATLTVDAAIPPHSLHATFLRPALRSEPVEYRVEPVWDGRTASMREVRAVQDDRLVLLASARFKAPEESGVLDRVPAPEVPGPDDCEPIGWDALLDTRVVASYSPLPRVHLCSTFWVRAIDPFPDDPALQACALTYFSDLGSGFATLDEPGIPAGGPSLDHAIWFHAPVHVSDWLLLDHRPQRFSDARGTYQGTIRNQHQVLGALLAQEVLLRPGPYDRVPPSANG